MCVVGSMLDSMEWRAGSLAHMIGNGIENEVWVEVCTIVELNFNRFLLSSWEVRQISMKFNIKKRKV